MTKETEGDWACEWEVVTFVEKPGTERWPDGYVIMYCKVHGNVVKKAVSVA